MFDQKTIEYYDAEAAAVVARRGDQYLDQRYNFIERLGPGAKVLELGCGGGHDAEALIAAGLDVTPTDGSAGIAKIAEARLGRPVRVMRFDELDANELYDGVWANRALLHVPVEGLAPVLTRVWRALRPGGSFFASYKAGEGAALDALGRYYNFLTEEELRQKYAAAADWSTLKIERRPGADHDAVRRDWFLCNARK